MTKFSKILCFISLFAILCICVILPCSALSSGIGVWRGFDSPFYCENVFYQNEPLYNLAWNSHAGISSTYIYDDYGNRMFSQNWDCEASNQTDVSFAYWDNYDGALKISTNNVYFIMPDDFSNYPKFRIETDASTILGNVDVACEGYYVDPYDVTHTIDFEYITSVYHDDYGSIPIFDYADISSSYVLLGIPAGSYVSIRYTLMFDVSCYPEQIISCRSNYNPDIFVDTYSPVITYETVDVLSWLPNTIDSFLNVEILPGVNFGNLLLMVIAVPAIFAVLKMLGGGG